MNIRAFGRLLFSGFGLPSQPFEEAGFLPRRSFWDVMESVERHVSAILFQPLDQFLAKNFPETKGLGFSGHRGMSKFRVIRTLGPKPKWLLGRALRNFSPKNSFRHPVLFGITTFVLLGSFVVGGLSDSADATTSCTSQQGSNGITDARVVGADCVLTFDSVGSFTWPRPTGVTNLAEVIVIAGGGAGGSRHGGGGGAGGFSRSYNVSIPSSSYSIVIGAGGIGTTNGSAEQTSGGNSSAFGITMTGGGRGGGTSWQAANGGSGGGRSYNVDLTLGGSGTAGQGNSGGRGRSDGGWAGGGGGGFAGAGQDSPSNFVGGAGGDGVRFNIRGSDDIAAAGGGGAGQSGAGAGGANGGGNGSAWGAGSDGASWGSGGGAGSFNDGAGVWGYKGGNGHRGAVLVRYAIPTAPSAPTLNSISVGNASLSVAFSAPSSDGNTAITNYEYSTDGGSTWKSRASGSTASPISITTVSSSAASLVNGTSYNVRIRAVNAIGSSTQSNQVTATPLTTPGPPTNLIATSTGQTTATVSFTAPVSNGGATITSYSVTSSPAGGSGTLAQAGSGTISVTGLTANTTYTFTVTATNSQGTSSASSASNSITTSPITHTITFNANGGTGSMADQVVVQSSATALRANTFTRDGYVFRGWNTAANGTGLSSFTDQESVSRTASLSLFAMWTSLDDRSWSASAQQDIFTATTPIPTATNSAFTAEAWIYPTTATGDWRNVFGSGTASNNESQRFFVGLNNSNQMYLSIGGAIETFFDTNIKFNEWAHIAIAVSASTTPTVDVYVNGQLLRTFSNQPNRQVVGSYFTIGSNPILNYNWTGEIDQVKIWENYLNRDQVAESMNLYQKGTLTAASTLRAHYDFNEFNSGVLLNRTGNATYNLNMSNTVGENRFSTSRIVETGTAHSLQSFVRFNRTYLTEAGGWTPPQNVSNFKALIVGGGGGGAKPGSSETGGGAAGGSVYPVANIALPNSAVPIVVGQGGMAVNSATGRGIRGGDSRLGALLVAGGEGGIGSGFTTASRLTATGGSSYVAGANGAGGRQRGWTTPTNAAVLGTIGGASADQTYNGQTFLSLPGVTGPDNNSSDAGTGGSGGQSIIRTSAITGAEVEYGKSGQLRVFSAGTQTIGSGGENRYIAATNRTPTDGAAGVVVLSYGATMEVTQSQGVARVGANFEKPIIVQLKNENGTNYTGADVQLTLSAASSGVLSQTTNGVTTNITSTTTTSRNGIATFSNIGFQSGVSGAQTLTVTADAFVGTSLSITPTFIASSVNITSSGPTNGTFIDGVFESNTSSAANILNSDLVTAMSSGSVLIESAGDATVINGFSSTTFGSNLTLKARGSITVNGSQTVKTNGASIIFWSDSDASGGGVIRLLNSSELCTTSATCNTATTGGGDIVLAGGAANADDPSRPGGFAAGFGSTYNSTGTTTTTGVQLGTIAQNDQGSRLYSAGGAITIRGTTTTDNTAEWKAGLAVIANSIIKSGNGTISIDVSYRSANAGHGPVEFNAWRGTGTTTISSSNTTSSAVVIRSYNNGGAAANLGVWGGGSKTIFDIDGGLVFEVDRIHKSVAFDFDVAGPLVFKPYGTTLLNETSNTSFELASQLLFTSDPSSITVGSSTNTSPIIISESLQTTSGNIELLSSGAISKTTTTTLTAAADIVVTSRSSSVDMGSGAVSASNIRISPSTTYVGSAPLTASNGVVNISGGSTVTLTGAILATGNITLAGSGNFSNSASITSSSGNIQVTTTGSATAVVTGNVQSTTGSIAFNTGGSYSGAGTLTAGTTVAVTSAGVTVGGNVLANGNVTYTSTGSLVQNADLRSSTGNVTMSISGAGANYTKGTSNLSALQEVSITSVASTVNTTGTGTISAGTVRLISSTGMTSAAPITSRGIVEIRNTSNTATVSGTTNAAGNLTISSPTVSVTATQTTTNSGNITITPTAAYSGAGQLRSSGNITISGGTTISPTANFSATGSINLSGSGQIYLSDADLESTSGTITLTAGPTADHAVLIRSSTVSTNTSRIQINASSTVSGRAFYLYEASTITSTSGTIDINATSGSEIAVYAIGSSSISSNSGDIEIAAARASGDWAIWLETTSILSNSGDISIDGGTQGIVAGWNTTTTIGAAASGTASGDITVVTDKYWGSSTGVNYKTTGAVVIESRANQFTDASFNGHTFSSHTTLRLGKATNQTAMTLSGGSINIAGNYSVYAGAITHNTGATTSSGSILIDPTTTYVGSGALTATNGSVNISTGTSVAPTGAIRARDSITLSGSGAITNSGATLTSTTSSVDITSGTSTVNLSAAVSAATTVSINASSTVTTSAAVSAATGQVTIISSAANLSIGGATSGTSVEMAPKTGYAGAGALTASSGTVRITGGTSVEPTGAIRATGDITLSGSAAITNSGASLTTTAGSIAITSTASTLNISAALSAPVNVTLTAHTSLTTSAAVTATNGTVTAESKTTLISIGGATAGRFVEILPKTTYVGAGALTASAGTVRITGGSSVAPTGAIQATSNIVLRGTGDISTATSATLNSSTGTVEVNSSAGKIELGLDIRAGASGAGVIGFLAKAADRIYMSSSADVETSGSDIVFWADSDNSGVGSHYFGGTNMLKSNGGDITVAGGLDDGAITNTEFVGRAAGDGHPDNYAAGNSFGENAGVEFLNSYQILSGGGDIFIAGRGSAVSNDSDMGVSLRGGLVYSAAGKIAVYGKSPASCSGGWHRGILTGWTAQTSIISESNASDAIYLYGNTASCNSGGSVYASAVEFHDSNFTNVVTPNGGDISIYGIQGNASYDPDGDLTSSAVQLRYFNLISNTGDISVNAVSSAVSGPWAFRTAWDSGNRRNIGALASSRATGYSAYSTIAVAPSSSDVTIKAESIWPSWITFRTTGHVKFLPNTSFESTKAHLLSSDRGVEFPLKMASFTFGAPAAGNAAQSSADIDLVGLSSSGPINVYGGEITHEGALSSDEDILLSGTKNVTVSFAVTSGSTTVIRTSGGDVALSANTTSGAGGLSVTASRDISSSGNHTTSNGGDITFGLARAYSGAGTITSAGSLSISDGTSIAPTGAIQAAGNITFAGSGAISNATGATLTSTAGDISLSTTGGAVTITKAVSATNIRVDSYGAVSTGTEKFAAAQDVQIESTTSTLTTGSGALTAGQDVNLVSYSNATIGGAITAGRKVYLDSSGTSSLNANITSGSQGILVKSAGRISSSDGTNAASPRMFATAGGPITLWTTNSATGGVSLGNFTQLNTIQSNAAGADITIGGGSETAAGSNLPAGNASSTSTHGVQIGARTSSFQASDFVVRAGTGSFSVKGAYAGSASGSFSGVQLRPGFDILAGTVALNGESSSTNNTTSQAGIDTYWNAGSVKSLINATKSFADYENAINISASSSAVHAALLGPSATATDSITLRASGEKAGISISGSTTRANSFGLWLASLTIETKNGQTTIDSGDDDLSLGRDSGRIFTFKPVSGQVGGDLEVKTADLVDSTHLSINTAGNVSFLPSSTSFDAAESFPTASSTVSVGSLTVGSSTNTQTMTVGAPVTSSGNITYSGASFAQASSSTTLSATASGSTVRIMADTAIALSASVLANNNGFVSLENRTSGTGIRVGGTNASTVLLTATELETHVSATTLRLGDRDRTGNVIINSNLNLTGKAQNLAIRSNADVSAGSGVVITVANLGIDAGGTISFPGTGGAASVIALNAGGITFNQSANYSVAVVDGIDPEFGLATKFVLSNVDRTNTVDRFMAVTFNPPPAVVLQDKFNNPLATNNLSASGYVVRSTMSVTRTDSGTLSLDGSTPTSQGGTSTFTALRVNGGTGEVAISYSAVSPTGTALVDASTGANSTAINYLIRAGEPASIELTFSSTTTRAGLTGLSPMATLKDSTGGTLTTGDYKNATVTITMTGDTNRIISGSTAPTTDGVARFPNLVVAGTAGTNAYTLTFSVSFLNSSNVTQTVSRSQVISITAGTPTTLAISSTSQTVVNRASLSDIALTVQDDYGNAAAFNSSTSIAATVSAGSNLGLNPTLSGTTTRSTDNLTSTATFSGLSLSAKVDTYTLTFSSGSLTSTSHTVRVTHGAASALTISAPSTAANDRTFGSNVVVDIVDLDGNVVTSGDQSTQTITLDANTTLTGTRAMSATAGRATFTNLRMLGLVGTKTLEASIGVPSSISNTASIVLEFGDATRVALTRQAAGIVNRADFTTQPVLAVLDSSGNVVTNHSQSITVTRAAVDAAKPATLTGTRTILPSSGVVTFTNLRLEGKVGEFDLTFESGSLSSTTQRVTLTHGAVENVVITGATTASNARTFGSAIRVEIQDFDGNLVTSGTAASQNVVLSVSGSTLSGTTTRQSVFGAIEFNDLVLTGSTGAKILTATISDPTTKTGTRTITVAHGAATQLALTTSASQAVSRQNLGVQPVIQVRDVSGNPVSDFVGRVSVAVSRASSGIPFSLTGTRVIDLNGSPTATFSGLGLYGEVGDFTFTYTGFDTAANQNLTSATQSITLAHGTATNLLITSPATARNAITLGSNISVEIRDQDNNRVTGSNEQVTLSISDATISGTAQRNAASGIATFGSLTFIGAEGAKTLTATLASPSLTETAALTLEYGEATKLAISQAASGAVNRANFSIQPIIQAQDVSGNVVDDYTSSVSIAVSRSASAVAFGLSGTGALNASAGIATFTGLGLFGATGDYTLTYSSGSLTTTSQTLRLTHGIATQVKIIDGPGGVQNGATFGRSIATQIQDQDGNVVSTGSDATAIVTLTPSGATLTGTRSKASSSGTASFGDLVMTGTTGSKTITATTATFTSAAYSVTLNVGAATKLVLTTSATGIVNRVDFATQPAVTVQDSSGNTVTSYSTDVTVSATPVDGSITATITGTLSRTPSTGISTFTNLRLDGKVGQYDLTFSSGSLSSTTQRVTLTHGAATAVVLSGATTSSNARTIATNIVAEIQDADANRVTTGSDSNQSVVITASGAVLSGTNTVNASAGVATFSNLTLTGTVGPKTLSAKILSPSEITGTRSIELAHGQATQLAIVTAASEALNRTAFTIQPVISVRDVSGNPVSDFVGRVSVAVSSSSSNTATLSGTTYRDLSGSPTATFSGLGLGGTLGSYTLTYSATDLTSATQSIVLAHGTATTLELVAPTTADNARVISTDVVVRLKDADGNLVTTGTPEVTLSISGATISGTAVRNLAFGEVSFPGLKFVGTTGSKTLSASITSPVSLTTSSAVQLSFGDATKLVVTTQASGAVNRQLFTTQPAVTVQDVSGNPVTSFAGTINLSVSPADAALSGTTSRVLSGSAVAYFDDLALNGKIGSYTLTFSSSGLSSDSQSISVEHGAATSLTVSVPASAVNNVGITDVVVRVLDQDLNLVTTGTPSISLAGSSAELTGTLVRNASSGIATFPGLKFIGEIGNKNVTASAASLSLTSMTSTVNLTYGAATQLVLTTPASGAVNRMAFATGAVVTLKDISGNTVIDSSATVTVSESSSAVALSGTANRTPINGVVSFSALGLNGTVGSYTLTYSSAGLTDITQTIDLTHGAATKIDIVTSAATSRSGQVFGTQPAVRILDQDNNLVSTGASSTATITAALTGLSDPAPVALNGTVAVAAVGGELTFVGLGLNGTADNYTIRYSSPNIASASQSIALLAGTPTAINIITGPANAIAGAGFGSAVSVELRDSANNRVLSDSTTDITATLVSSSDVSTRSVTTTTVRVTNGLATFTGLNYTLAGDHKISFEAGALSQIGSSFTITHAIASKFTIQTQPASMRNDIVVGVAPALRIFDAYDNPVLSGATVGVTATVVGSNSSDITAISGNTTSSTANTNLVGLANLKLKGKVSDYVIRFTGSVSGTSFTIDSDPTALTFGTPTQLVLTQSAAGARAGLAFDTQPQLAIRDNSDNLVADSTLRVTATVTGRSLVGISAVSASSGVVSFTGSGLGIAGEAATGLVIRYATQTLTGSTLEVSQNIDLTPGAAVKLSIIQQPATVLTRLEFANDVSVQLLDQYDNPVPSDSTSNVSIQLFKGLSPALATGGSTLTLTAKRASSGVATFNGLTLPVEPGADYFLKFTIGSFTISSSQFEVLPGAVSSMAITQQPSTVVGAGLSRTGDLIAVQPQVTLYDADGYLARGASGNVTVAISSGVGGNLTEGTITAAVSNGVARFEGVRLVGTPAQQSAAAVDYRLRFSFTNEVSTVITSPESNVLNVTNAAASKLIISRGAASGDAGRDFRTQPIVHIVDRYNNIVETGSDANLLVIASSPTADSLSDNQVNAASGVATFEDLALGGQVNTNYSIVFEVENRGDITSVTQSNIQIGFGLANKLRIVTQPASLSGSDLTKSGDTLPTQPAVEILDSFNNRVTNSNRQISITLTRDGAALDAKDRLIGGVATPSSGVATFSGVGIVGRPGDTYKLAFSATGLTGVTSAGLVVRHGDPTVLEFVDQPVSILGGVLTKTGSLLAGQPKLRLLDFDGNVATEINDVSISAFVARGGGSTLTEVDSNNVPKNTANFVNGVATFTNLAVIATPGIEQALRFETVVRGATLQSPESSGISFTHGDAHQLAISTQPCAGAVVSAVCETGITGEDLTVQPVIEVQDRYGNRVVNFSGEITVSTTANRGQLSDRDLITVNEITATASSGVATFTGLNLVATPGDQVQLLFTSGSLNSATSNAITVRAAAASSIAVITEPVGARTGSVLAIDPVIELRDRFGNLAASDNVSRITVTSSSGTLTGTTTATATAGRVTFSGLSYTGVPGLYATLTFTGVNGANVALTGISSSGFTVKNALANTAVITQQPTATATGALLGEAVIALRDFDNNLAEDDSATVVRVEIAAGDGLARFVNESDQTIVDSATSTILRQTASGGVVRFNGLRLVGTPGVSYQLIFTANPDNSGASYATVASNALVLTHAEPASLSVTDNPVGDMTNTALTTQPALRVLDRYGNLATSNNTMVVTATLFESTGGVIRSGGSATAAGGIVTFSGLTVDGTPGALYKLRFTAGGITVDDTIGFRLKKNADIALSYDPVNYSPSGTVTRLVVTDSPGTPVYSTTSSSSICTVNSSTGVVSIIGVGDCMVNVLIPDTTYYIGGNLNALLVINKANQASISVTSSASVPYLQSRQLTALGGSGTGALIFSATGNCRVVDSILIPGDINSNSGTSCRVRVEREADANYELKVSDWQTITVTKITQAALVIGNSSELSVGDVNLFTHGGSGSGAVTYLVDPDDNDAQCQVLSATVLRAGADGTCSVTAFKAGSPNYIETQSALKTFTFQKAAQTVYFTSTIPERPLAGGDLYQPVATSSSGLGVTYSITSGNNSVCRFDLVETNKVQFLTMGNCEITATQAGDSQYVSARAKQVIAVGLRNQSITFMPLEDQRYGQPAFMLTATASSGLAVSFQLDSAVSSQACRVTTAGLVSIDSAGTCAIKASQPGNSTFQAAPDVTQKFTVTPDRAGAPHLVSVSASDQTITATFTAPSYLGGSDITRYRMEVSQVGSTNKYVNFACQANPLVPCRVSGLPNANNESYTVRVAAVTAAGIGAYSRSSEPLSTAEASAAVSNLTASASSTRLDLVWDEPIAIPGTFQSYQVYVWPMNDSLVPSTPTITVTDANADGTSITVTSPSGGGQSLRRSVSSVVRSDAYNIRVVTITNRITVAQPTNTSNGMKIGATTPGSPDEVELNDLSDKVIIGWSAPTFDGGHPVLGYIVKVNGEIACDLETQGGQQVCEDSDQRIFEWSELSAGSNYLFEIAAVNLLGVGSMASDTHNIPAPVAPGSGSGGTYIPGTPVGPGPAKPDSGTSGPDVLNPDSWNPTAPGAESPGVDPVAPAEPKPETNASGEQNSVFDPSWLLWLLLLISGGGGLSLLARRRRRKPRQVEGFVYPSPIAESTQFKDS